MTIRKQLLIAVIGSLLFAICITLLMGVWSMDRSVRHYIQETYDQRVEQIKSNAALVIQGQMTEAEAYVAFSNVIAEPIDSLQVFNQLGRAVLQVEKKDQKWNMHGRMMDQMIPNTIDRLPIVIDGTQIGLLVIERSGTIHSTESVMLFKQGLYRGMGVAGLIAIVIGLFIALSVSRRLSRDLRLTAEMATKLDGGGDEVFIHSNVVEIQSLQETLGNLSAKLKIQQMIRKENSDQLAHEARTPIMILKSQLEGVVDHVYELDESRINSCLVAVDQLTKIVEEMSTVIEGKRDKVVINITPFVLSETLHQIVASLKHAFLKKNISVETSIEPHILIHSDQGLLTQCVYNLLTNACKFTQVGGRVFVSLEQKDESIIVQIQDNGPGIIVNDRDKVFEAYYRGQSELSNSVPGDGLGLFIVKQNMESLGGSIHLDEGNEGQGCTFVITL